MKKIVLWGVGLNGQSAYRKMKAQFEIVYFVDDTAVTTGEKLFGIPVISVLELRERYSDELDIVVCTKNYFRVSAQLIEMGIDEYYVMMEGFLYHNSADESMMPVELSTDHAVKKEKGEKNVLFVQRIADSGTSEMAVAMREAGYKVYLLYMLALQENDNGEPVGIYAGEFTFYTANGMVDFIENSDFDLVHSVDSSLILANIILSTSKHIILQVDQEQCETVEDLFLEYAMVTQSDGIICSSQKAAEDIKRKYGVKSKAAISVNRAALANELSEFYEKVKQQEIIRGQSVLCS